jgi:hypothetical protein
MDRDLTDEERAAFRAFVREHHPDRGGDPEVFVAGMARFRAGNRPPFPDRSGAGDGRPGPPRGRYDAPVEVVPTLPPPVRVVVALLRTWRRHRRTRVDHRTSRDPAGP